VPTVATTTVLVIIAVGAEDTLLVLPSTLDATVGDDVGPIATQHGVTAAFGTMGRCDLCLLMLFNVLCAASITFIQPITAKEFIAIFTIERFPTKILRQLILRNIKDAHRLG